MEERYRREQSAAVERRPSVERYRPVMVGGRVKTAGVSFRYLYDAAAPLNADPTSAAAFETSKNFARLKENPPFPFRAAFFPQDEAAMRTAFRGLGIYRPTIKTDQGPAGNVGYFYLDGQRPVRQEGRIAKEEGVGLVESFLQQRIAQGDLSDDERAAMGQAIAHTQTQYQRGNFKGAFEGIMRLRELASSYDIETSRRAGVGRGEFFFFRPVTMEQDVVIGKELTDTISAKTHEVVGRIEHLASLTKRFVQDGLPLDEAVKRAYEGERFYNETSEAGFLYFQPDVLIRKDGTFDIERVNLPDLGMFLTAIETPVPNNTLNAIKDINEKIKTEVSDSIAEEVGTHTILLTRGEVLDNAEDTLEQLELQTVGRGLEERGIDTHVASLDSVATLPGGSSVLLFNIPPEVQALEILLTRVARGELRCFPDPFVKLFEREATTFERKRIDDGRVIDRFLQTIAPSALDKPEGVYRRYQGIQGVLKRGGIDSDIVYFSINGNGNYVPTFRYDVKSFFEVQKAVEAQKRQGNHVSLTAIPVPFRPEDAIIEGPDGPRLAVFRFMFVRK